MNTESLEKGTQQNNSAPKRTQISVLFCFAHGWALTQLQLYSCGALSKLSYSVGRRTEKNN